MKNKVLFKVGGISVDTKTLLTVAGVVAGIVAIKKLSEAKSSKALSVSTGDEATEIDYENYVDEDFMGYVDEGFMGVVSGDESMKFGGGKPIAFANAGGTDNAIYEPNFYNSDGQVPIATDEPNFANSDGVYALGEEGYVNPNAAQIAQKRGLFGRKRRKAMDLDGSIGVGSKRKRAKIIAKAKAKGMPIGAVPPPVAKGRKKRGIRSVEVSQDQ
jgi:hypothetical protein